MYNAYCLVNYCHYETTRKTLECEECPLRDKCKDYETAKKFSIDKKERKRK